LPQTPQRGYLPYALPYMEECTYLWGVNTSWGINMTESKRPLNQEDNQAPQPTYCMHLGLSSVGVSCSATSEVSIMVGNKGEGDPH
jgi:hypothetical protein